MAPSRRQPEPALEFLVDRSLGRYLLPNALKALGHTTFTLADIYGESKAQSVEDEVWIARAGKEGWVVLTKDDAIRRRPAELEAFVAAKLRVFCLTTANLNGAAQTARFVDNINRIVQRARSRGPYIYGVYERELRRIWPR